MKRGMTMLNLGKVVHNWYCFQDDPAYKRPKKAKTISNLSTSKVAFKYQHDKRFWVWERYSNRNHSLRRRRQSQNMSPSTAGGRRCYFHPHDNRYNSNLGPPAHHPDLDPDHYPHDKRYNNSLGPSWWINNVDVGGKAIDAPGARWSWFQGGNRELKLRPQQYWCEAARKVADHHNVKENSLTRM